MFVKDSLLDYPGQTLYSAWLTCCLVAMPFSLLIGLGRNGYMFVQVSLLVCLVCTSVSCCALQPLLMGSLERELKRKLCSWLKS